MQDFMFFAYFDMVVSLTQVLESCGQWAESCPCHEDMTLDLDSSSFSRPDHTRRASRDHVTLPAMFGKLTEVCPMRGKRLPELVGGGIQKVLENLAGVAYGDLLQKHYPLLKPEQWSVVVDDFEKGKALGLLEFFLKFDWTLRLPWKLALLGHHDHGLARRELQANASEFDSQPAELQKHHHNLTLKLLSKDRPLRKLKEFDLFACGQKVLAELPMREAYAACFRFVQITERSYEAAHSIVKRRAPPNAKGATISLTLRLLDLACDIKLEPETLVQVAEMFDNARDVTQIPHLLGNSTHPAYRLHSCP